MEQQGVTVTPDADSTLLSLPLPPPPPMPVDSNSAPLPPPPPIPAEYSNEAGQPPPEDMDMDMEMDAVPDLPPPPPPPPPVEGSSAAPAAPGGEAQGGPTLPGPPITLPAPPSAAPGPPITLPAPENAEPTQQGGEMSEEQYNAMTPEQQAAYWHQWQQYTSQQFQGAAPEQQHLDPSAHYAQDPNYQAYYAQYQYGQPDAQQWAQYAVQPQQQHYGEQPDYSYYNQQQQAQQGGSTAQHLPQGHSQPYPPQATPGPTVHYSTAPDSSAAYTYSAAPAAAYSAGLGMPLELPQLAPPKKAVPDWLRAEMLKRGIGQNAQAAPKPGSDSDSEPEQKRSRRLAQAGGSRWGGDEEKGSSRRAASGGGSSSEEDEEKLSRAEELRRERLDAVVKRNLTGILLEVTDALFDEIAKKALHLAADPEDPGAAAVQPASKPDTTVAAVIVNRSDDSEGSDGSGGDALGLGYGSDDGSGSDGEDVVRKEARSLPDQGAAQEVSAPEEKQDSPAPGERQPVDVKEEQSEHKQDGGRTSEAAEVQPLAESSVVESGAGILSEAGLLMADNIAEHGSMPPQAADAAKADGTGSAAGGQVAAPHGKPASLTNGSTPVQALFSKGSSVWYHDRDRKRQAAIVMSVDVMHPPASYCIRLEGADNTRDTEESRLEPRPPQDLPVFPQSTPEAMAASLATPDSGALPQPAAGELEHRTPPEDTRSKSGVSASVQPADSNEESKRKRKGTGKSESRKSKSSRRDEKAGRARDKERAKEKVKGKEKEMEGEKRSRSKRDSKDESGKGISEDREGRSRGDRHRRQSSRSLSRSRSRERHTRARSQSRERRRDRDRRGSRSTSRDRRRRFSVSRSPQRGRRDSDSRIRKRSRRGDS